MADALHAMIAAGGDRCGNSQELMLEAVSVLRHAGVVRPDIAPPDVLAMPTGTGRPEHRERADRLRLRPGRDEYQRGRAAGPACSTGPVMTQPTRPPATPWTPVPPLPGTQPRRRSRGGGRPGRGAATVRSDFSRKGSRGPSAKPSVNPDSVSHSATPPRRHNVADLRKRDRIDANRQKRGAWRAEGCPGRKLSVPGRITPNRNSYWISGHSRIRKRVCSRYARAGPEGVGGSIQLQNPA